MRKAPLIVAGTIFGLIAIIHLSRLYYHFAITIGSTEIPFWANIIGFCIAAVLSFWMFYTASRE